MAIGATVRVAGIIKEATSKGHDEQAVIKAIAVQSARGKYKSKRQGKDLERALP